MTGIEFSRKSVSAVLSNSADGEFYVFVARGWPHWVANDIEDSVFNVWDKKLAPSRELLDQWNSTILDWVEWESQYIDEVGEECIREQVAHWAEVARREEKSTVVFVCYEGDDDWPECHTWTILDVIERGTMR